MRTAIIIIPTYNEAENIKALLEKVSRIKRDGLILKTLVVDDSSPDGTGKRVVEFRKRNKKVFLITNKSKMGLGHAYMKGMRYAIGSLRADILIEMDADLSHDPKDLPRLLRKIDEGNDLVLGSRYVKGGNIPGNWGIHRKLLSYFGNIMIGVSLGNLRIKDWSTGYRAMKSEVYKKIAGELGEDLFQGYAFQIGFLHKALKNGFRVAELPIVFSDRRKGKSKLGFEYIKNTLLFIWKARFSGA